MTLAVISIFILAVLCLLWALYCFACIICPDNREDCTRLPYEPK